MALEHGVTAHVAVDPPEAPVEPHLDQSDITIPMALGFFVAMTLAGLAIGKVLGDEFQLLPSLSGGSDVDDAQIRAWAVEAVEAIRNGDKAPHLSELAASIQGPTQAAHAFGEGRLEQLGQVLERPASAYDPAARAHLDHAYALLAHLASVSGANERMEIVATMLRRVPEHRRLASHLIQVAKTHPDVWNDVQHRLDDLAAKDAQLGRLMEEQAGPGERFVADATGSYMTDMVRFKRLSEDHGNGMGGIVDNELKSMIAHEFLFLELSGHVTRRFLWLPTEIWRIHKLIEHTHVSIALDAAGRGVAEAASLLTQVVLSWTREGGRLDDSAEVIEGLGEAAMEHASAADALIGIFVGLHPRDGDLNSEQKKVRKAAYLAIEEASHENYEVLTRMAAQQIPPNLYEDDSDDPSEPVPVKVAPSDPLRAAAGQALSLDAVNDDLFDDDHDIPTTVSQEGIRLL
jgi:hypothetical protein